MLDGKIRWRGLISSKPEVDKLVTDRIGAVVSLEESPVSVYLDDKYGKNRVNHPIPDPATADLPEDIFYRALTVAIPVMTRVLKEGGIVCVHCLGGTDRSPGLVAAFLRIRGTDGWVEEAEGIRLSQRMKELVDYSVARYCTERLATDFLREPHRFYSERSVHSQLFHYLSLAGMSKTVRTAAGYPMGTIQQEYPPIKPDSGKTRRGLYDLVVFDQKTISSAAHWDHREDDGSRQGEPLSPLIAVEVGLDKGLSKDPVSAPSRLADFQKELARLANPSNKVRHGFLLYLYRYATFHREAVVSLLRHIREEAAATTKTSPNLDVIVAAAGYAEEAKFNVIESNTLRVRGGDAVQAEGPLLKST